MKRYNICRKNKAEIPDRESMSPQPKICPICHNNTVDNLDDMLPG